MSDRADVIVVGSGMVGSWAAKCLTEGGAHVELLEAGPSLTFGKDVTPSAWEPIGETPPPERVARQSIQARCRAYHTHTAQLFVDDVDNPYETPADRDFTWLRSRNVGGRGVFWARVALRMSPFELSGHGDAAWPLEYRELEPFYDEVEHFYGCVGNDDGLDWLPAGNYGAPLGFTPGEEHLAETLRARWPARRLVHQRAFPMDAPRLDPDWPRFTPQGSSLHAARGTGRLRLRTGAIAAEILIDPQTGRARGVRVIDAVTHRDEVIEAKTVVVAASAFESVRLLLASRGPDGEAGLGSRSGQLGRGIMDHVITTCIGRVHGLPAPAAFRTFGGESGAYIPRFQNLPGDRGEHEDPGFAGGYGIQVGCQRLPLDEGFLLVAVGEMLPNADNRLSLGGTRDAVGMPVLRIDCRFGDNEKKMQAHMAQELHAIATAAGFDVRKVIEGHLPGEFLHECGGARTGKDQTSSVVDPSGRVWECENVFVVDGAVWPSCGYQNPTLTMMAFASMACSVLLRDLRSGKLT